MAIFGSGKSNKHKFKPAAPWVVYVGCMNCGHGNDKGETICAVCGRGLETDYTKLTRCDYCGTLNDLTRSSCIYCGDTLTNKKPYQAPAAAITPGSKNSSNTQQTTAAQPTVRIQQSIPQPAETRTPLIPSNNRYAGHEELVSRIAMDIVSAAFSNVKPLGWVPVSRNTVAREYDLKLSIEKGYISTTCIWGRESSTKTFHFTDYGMKELPNVADFAAAIEPFIKKHANDAGSRAFANIDKRSSYSVECYRDTFYGTPMIAVYIKQILHPDNNLKSW